MPFNMLSCKAPDAVCHHQQALSASQCLFLTALPVADKSPPTDTARWCRPVFSFSSACTAVQPPNFQPVMQHLVSVSIIGTHDDMTDESLSSTVHQEMGQWFGDKQTADWKLLKVYRIPFAQPSQVRQTR